MTTLPDWLLERAALGEVPDASRHRLASADPVELEARLERLRAEDAAELRAHPPGPAVAQIAQAAARERARRSARRRRSQAVLVAGAGALAMAMAVLFVGLRGEWSARQAPIAPDRPAAGAGTPPETTRVKGSARLTAFRKAGSRVDQLTDGATVRAGEVLQLRYSAAGRRFGLIASIDGAGAVTLHFPDDEAAPTALAAGPTDLPHAYQLDDAPRFERFIFITDDRPIDVGRTLAALRALAGRPGGGERAALALPPHASQVSLLLHKAPRR